MGRRYLSLFGQTASAGKTGGHRGEISLAGRWGAEAGAGRGSQGDPICGLPQGGELAVERIAEIAVEILVAYGQAQLQGRCYVCLHIEVEGIVRAVPLAGVSGIQPLIAIGTAAEALRRIRAENIRGFVAGHGFECLLTPFSAPGYAEWGGEITYLRGVGEVEVGRYFGLDIVARAK